MMISKKVFLKKITTIVFVFISTSIFSQVGIGNTSPEATLDISASNVTTPSNNDGILIPRIDDFSTIDPTASQDGMLVFITGNGTPAKGFWYWDNGVSSWLPIGGVSSSWDKSGNAGTTNGIDFLGTTDNQALDIRTNNVIHARFKTDGKLDILNTGNSVYIGENAGNADPTTVDKENVMIGNFAGENVTTSTTKVYHGKYNTGIGFKALNKDGTGQRNTAVGHEAALNITTGNFNTAMGVGALRQTTIKKYNTAIGMQAVFNMNGHGNTGIGYRALSGDAPNISSGTGQYNTAIGYNAAYQALDGDDNVFLGKGVDYNNQTGSENVVIGSAAGRSTVEGGINNLTGRVLIGFSAGKDILTDNVLYIENSASAIPLIGGDFATDRVGINTDPTTLTHTFTVTGTANITQLLNITPSTAPASPVEGDIYYDSATKKLRVYTGAAWEDLN